MNRRLHIMNGPRSARPVSLTRPGGAQSWFRISNRTSPTAATSEADVYLLDEIGGWGVTAGDFISALRGVDADRINLHINSPGGDVFDGVAIYNALVQHKAYVTVYVDGLAASAASFIAMAGDKVIASRGSMMMIHDASGFCMGPASEMRAMADLLDKVSDTIADIYAGRTGKPADAWRASMLATTWYTAAEAVEAGLADELTDAEDTEATTTAKAWARTVFNHRTEAPEAQQASPVASPSPVDLPTVGAQADPHEVAAPVAAVTADPAPVEAAAETAAAGPADTEQAPAQAADAEPADATDEGCGCTCDACVEGNCDECTEGCGNAPNDADAEAEDAAGEQLTDGDAPEDAACSCPCDSCVDDNCDGCTEDCGRGKRSNDTTEDAAPAAAHVEALVLADTTAEPLRLGTTDTVDPTRPSTTSPNPPTDAWADLVERLVGPPSPHTADDVLATLRGALL